MRNYAKTISISPIAPATLQAVQSFHYILACCEIGIGKLREATTRLCITVYDPTGRGKSCYRMVHMFTTTGTVLHFCFNLKQELGRPIADTEYRGIILSRTSNHRTLLGYVRQIPTVEIGKQDPEL